MSEWIQAAQSCKVRMNSGCAQSSKVRIDSDCRLSESTKCQPRGFMKSKWILAARSQAKSESILVGTFRVNQVLSKKDSQSRNEFLLHTVKRSQNCFWLQTLRVNQVPSKKDSRSQNEFWLRTVKQSQNEFWLRCSNAQMLRHSDTQTLRHLDAQMLRCQTFAHT